MKRQRQYTECGLGRSIRLLNNKLGFQILKNSDIVWVYHLNTKAKLYGVVTTGSFHAVALRTEDGGDHRALTMGTNGAQELLQYLFPRLPPGIFWLQR